MRVSAMAMCTVRGPKILWQINPLHKGVQWCRSEENRWFWVTMIFCGIQIQPVKGSFLYRKLGLIFVEHQKMQCFPKIDLTMKWLKKFLMRLWHVKFQCFVHSSLSCQIKHDRWWCYRILIHLTFIFATSKIYFYHQFFRNLIERTQY